ncbi:hypothetical protein MD484_g4041, partial [Candolleomyces efflorescens]
MAPSEITLVPIPDTPAPGDAVFPRERVAQRLLWASIALSVFAFACSMVWLGITSFYITPCAFFLSVAYDITLLLLISRERKRAANQDLYATPSTQPVTDLPTLPLPPICRKPAIILSIFLLPLWVASAVINITFIGGDTKLMLPTISEVNLDGLHVLVLAKYCHLCIQERRRRMSRG